MMVNVHLKHKKVRNVICQYCGNETKLVGGDVIYPHRSDLSNSKFYLCEQCNAYVGTHKRPNDDYYEPLGTLANEETRKARKEAHAVFDMLWRKDFMKRSEAYKWLAKKLNIPIEKCHIGSSDVNTCILITEISRAKLISVKKEMTKSKLKKLLCRL